MLYFKEIDGVVVDVSDVSQRNEGYVSRWDFKTLYQVSAIAASANALNDGHAYVATDAGPSTSPRYDVIRLPKVGDKVSYGFNGDYYPDGEIASISQSLKVIRTSTGGAYYRRRLSGSWVKDGTWSLVAG